MSEPVMRIASGSEKGLPRKISFTVAALAGVVCPPGRDRLYIYDSKVPGLCAAITPKGGRSYFLLKKIDGRTRRVRLGGSEISIEQARRLAATKNGEIADGIDPTAAKRAVRSSITLQELFDKYTEDHCKLRCTERTLVTDKSRFDSCLASLKARKLLSIRPADVRALHTNLGKSTGKTSANRAVQLLRRMFNWAKVEPNPAAKGVVDFFRENERDRFIGGDELPRFFAALEAEPNVTIRDYIMVSLWSGARRANVQAMRWGEINFETATWTVPANASKSGEAMKIHLSPPALAVLKERQGNGSDHVFPGRGKSGHLVEPKSTWKRILERAKISDLHLHDLRRTLGSWQASTGASLHVIGKSLGHHDVATTAIYARMNLDPVRASVNAAVEAMQAAGAIKPAQEAGTATTPLPAT